MFQALWECHACGHQWGAPVEDLIDACPACGSAEIEQDDQPVAIN